MKDLEIFQRTAELAKEALLRGDDPFACVLVDTQGNIVLEQANLAGTNKNPMEHDVILLLQKAIKTYSQEELSQMTIYALVEPCVMCMGAMFWANAKSVKYAMSEEQLEYILPGGLVIHSKEFCERNPKSILSQAYPEYVDELNAKELVKEWVRSWGIPGLPKED